MITQLVHKADDFGIPDFDFRSLGERELARLWRDQTFPAEALVTSAGDRLRVIYRGRPGGGAGPDFRDALIAAPGGLLQGDVELHVRSSDFHRHGHGRDPAYAGVVLHLVWRDDEGRPTPLCGGGLAAVVALGDWARGRAAEIERWLERPALWREPCFSALHRLGAAEVEAALERLGEMRFRQKAAAFARRIGEIGDRKSEPGVIRASGHLPAPSLVLSGTAAEQVLWEAVMEALAFGSAPEEFRLLAQRLSWSELRARLVALPQRQRVGEAWRLLAAAAGGFTNPRGGGRPAGRPERRLRGAAQLASRFAERGPLQAFFGLVEGESSETENDEAKARGPKIEGAKSEGGTKEGVAPFRISNFEFRSSTRRRDSQLIGSLTAALTVPGLIGRSRAVEMIGNAVLPCLAALGPEALRRRAEALNGRLPLPARYGAVRHLHEAVGDEGSETRKTKNENRAAVGDEESGNRKTEYENRSAVGDEESENRKTENENRADDFRLSSFDFRRDGAGVRIDFRRQQGMLYLLRQYCTRGGCGRCPLS